VSSSRFKHSTIKLSILILINSPLWSLSIEYMQTCGFIIHKNKPKRLHSASLSLNFKKSIFFRIKFIKIFCYSCEFFIFIWFRFPVVFRLPKLGSCVLGLDFIWNFISIIFHSFFLRFLCSLFHFMILFCILFSYAINFCCSTYFFFSWHEIFL
jgi:hypothetical protein